MIGVLEPGALAAVNHTQNNHIGIIGTEATINSGAYELAILEQLQDANLISEACQLLVPLVEEGWTHNTITDQVIAAYLAPFKHTNIDTLVLGCTHFPCLKHAIQTFMGNEVRLIDAADTAKIIYEDLQSMNLLNPNKEKLVSQFLVTDTPERFKKISHVFDQNIHLESTTIQTITL